MLITERRQARLRAAIQQTNVVDRCRERFARPTASKKLGRRRDHDIHCCSDLLPSDAQTFHQMNADRHSSTQFLPYPFVNGVDPTRSTFRILHEIVLSGQIVIIFLINCCVAKIPTFW
jgi:hypothetical protein